MTTIVSNDYFSALPVALRNKWAPQTRHVDVDPREPLQLDSASAAAYFPINCIAAQFVKDVDGVHHLNRLNGRHTTVGLSVELIMGRIHYEHCWIHAGAAIVMPREIIVQSVSAEGLKKGQSEFLGYSADVVATRAGCRATHSLSERLSCVLLQLFDLGWSCRSDVMQLGLLERLTSVRRDALSSVLGDWRRQGILGESDAILSENLGESLRRIVCDCYQKHKEIDAAMFESWRSTHWMI